MIEGRTIQKRLPKTNVYDKHEEKLSLSFSKLMFQGKTKAALQLLAQQGKGRVLHLGDIVNKQDSVPVTVLDVLRSKHPYAQPARPEAMILGNPAPPSVHPVVFDQINANSIRAAALRTNGAAGPSGIDAHSWRRLCTSFKSASNELCHSLALLARRLCTQFVDPQRTYCSAGMSADSPRQMSWCETYRDM